MHLFFTNFDLPDLPDGHFSFYLKLVFALQGNSSVVILFIIDVFSRAASIHCFQTMYPDDLGHSFRFSSFTASRL